MATPSANPNRCRIRKIKAKCSFRYTRSDSSDKNVGMMVRVFPRCILAKGELAMFVVYGKLLGVVLTTPRKTFRRDKVGKGMTLTN